MRPQAGRLSALAAVALCFFASEMATAGAADYIDLRKVALLENGNAVAGRDKAATCIACHGVNGISPVPSFPNLQGQTAEYLYWALVDFQRETQANSPMAPVVASLEEQDLRDLAAFYAAQGTTTSAGVEAPGQERGDPSLLARGEALYLRGDAPRGIPPCQGCHGVEGRGHPLAETRDDPARGFYRTFPALRGQKADYLSTKLTAYRDGEPADSTNDYIMNGVARHLDADAILALTTWLASR